MMTTMTTEMTSIPPSNVSIADYQFKIDSLVTENNKVVKSLNAKEVENLNLLTKLETSNKELTLIKNTVMVLDKDNNKLKSLVSFYQTFYIKYFDDDSNEVVYSNDSGTVSPIIRKVWGVKADSSMPFEYFVRQEIALGVDTFNTRLQINDYPIVAVTDKSNGIFKAPTRKAYVTFNNPYMSIKTMEVIVESEEKSPIKKGIAPATVTLLAFILGLLL